MSYKCFTPPIRGPPGPPGPPGPGIMVENTIFVDSKFGDDTTGKIEDPGHPFKT